MYSIVYKVCTVDNREGRRVYCSARILDEPFKLTYAVNTWTFPQVGKCLCFADLDSAQDFRLYDEKVFCAVAMNAVPCAWLFGTRPQLTVTSVDILFRTLTARPSFDELLVHHGLDTRSTPRGTLMADAIMLLPA